MNISKIQDHEFGEVFTVTSFHKPGFARRNPRTKDRSLSRDMLVTLADGTQYTVVGPSRSRKSRNYSPRVPVKSTRTDANTRYQKLLDSVGAIGDVN